MTRINLIDVELLSDQHLAAEYRELPRIYGDVRALVSKGKKVRDVKFPSSFVLGKGHMTFFYNKLGFLVKRQQRIIDESILRGTKIQYTEPMDISDIPVEWCNDYTPRNDEVRLSNSRLIERIGEKPSFYKWHKKQRFSNTFEYFQWVCDGADFKDLLR